MRARIEPVAGGDDLDIPMPAMAPAYRVGAQRRGGGMDPATKRLAIFAGGIGGALLLLVAIWSFNGHHRAGVPVIEPDAGPVRVKPANPGGLQIAGANESILSGDANAKVAMAPPPEAPAPQALKAEEQHAAAAARAAEQPAPVATKLAVTPPTAQPAPVDTSRPAPRTAEAKATPTRAERPAPPPAAKASGAMVQLAALESEDGAKSEWKRLERRYHELLGGRTPTFTRTEHAGRTYWRVRTGGFADVAEAVRFCERIKAKGGGCSVASF